MLVEWAAHGLVHGAQRHFAPAHDFPTNLPKSPLVTEQLSADFFYRREGRLENSFICHASEEFEDIDICQAVHANFLEPRRARITPCGRRARVSGIRAVLVSATARLQISEQLSAALARERKHLAAFVDVPATKSALEYPI